MYRIADATSRIRTCAAVFQASSAFEAEPLARLGESRQEAERCGWDLNPQPREGNTIATYRHSQVRPPHLEIISWGSGFNSSFRVKLLLWHIASYLYWMLQSCRPEPQREHPQDARSGVKTMGALRGTVCGRYSSDELERESERRPQTPSTILLQSTCVSHISVLI